MALIRYLALGDSYTIGTGVLENERWPSQLVQLLLTNMVNVAAPEYVARDGWTTDELLTAIREAAPRGPYGLVSLLVGVNNQYRGLSPEAYRGEFRGLLDLAVGFAGGDSRRVIVLSIPDWSVTPFAEGREQSRISLEIGAFNAANHDEAARAGARYVDVTPESRMAGSDSALLAGDGLHPSGAMYERWARLALPEALLALSNEPESRI